ncbi:MAG: DUF455 family protein [Alphaproteobacteria bacterium]|nr:MAG: DUF455 family protein [Alphaproteobacteria bacterium]
MHSLAEGALAVLTSATDKVALTNQAASLWRAGGWPVGTLGLAPERPARPQRPLLQSASHMPRRRITRGTAGRIGLLHALAHIELNAIDLAWDMVLRFGQGMPTAFLSDWVHVAEEEALHFALLAARLAELGAAYGDLPAHDGLWEAAQDTANDRLARLAVVPMVLEARGLDVTPQMIQRLAEVEDQASAGILQRIHDDEIGHVAIGLTWFHHEATSRGLTPATAWQEAVRTHFRGAVKPPFNHTSRSRAGFPADWYEALAA